MKKLTAILLAAAMLVLLLAGCGNTETTSASSSSGSSAASTDSAPAASSDSAPAASSDSGKADAAPAPAEDEEEEEEEEEEMADIKIAWLTTMPLTTDQTDPVVAAVNAVTEDKINVHVDIDFFDAGTYASRVPMMIQAGEKLDLLLYTPIPGTNFQSFRAQNQLMDISEYLDKYTGIGETLGELLQGTAAGDGSVYGVACNRIMASQLTIVMRTDVLEQLGLLEKAQNMTTWTEYEEILKEVVAKTDYAGIGNADAAGTTLAIAPYFTHADSFADDYSFDSAGESNYLVYVDEETDTVRSYYGSEQFRAAAERAYNWYKEGLVYKDATMSTNYGVGLMRNDVCFSVLATTELGSEEVYESQTGFDLTFVKVMDMSLGTDATYKFGFVVPVTATEPEAAVRFLNLLYTESDLNNILSWGVEGRDWVLNGGCADYPEGVTSETVTYHMMDIFGNQFLTLPWIDNGPDFRDIQMAEQNNLVYSKFMGFSPETADLSTIQTACMIAVDQYKATLSSGAAADFEATYNAFQEALESAGINDLCAAYQAQLDAWLAESGR